MYGSHLYSNTDRTLCKLHTQSHISLKFSFHPRKVTLAKLLAQQVVTSLGIILGKCLSQEVF